MATFLLAFGALFSIVNPLSGAFIFYGQDSAGPAPEREHYRPQPLVRALLDALRES